MQAVPRQGRYPPAATPRCRTSSKVAADGLARRLAWEPPLERSLEIGPLKSVLAPKGLARLPTTDPIASANVRIPVRTYATAGEKTGTLLRTIGKIAQAIEGIVKRLGSRIEVIIDQILPRAVVIGAPTGNNRGATAPIASAMN